MCADKCPLDLSTRGILVTSAEAVLGMAGQRSIPEAREDNGQNQVQLTLEKMMRVRDANTLTIKNQNITLEWAFQIHSAASWYSTNCKSCNTVVFIEKLSVYKWTHPCRSHPRCSRVNRIDSDKVVTVRESPGVKE